MFRKQVKYSELPGILEVEGKDGTVHEFGLLAGGGNGLCRVRMGRAEEALGQEMIKKRRRR